MINYKFPLLFVLYFFLNSAEIFAQEKKVLSHSDYDAWNELLRSNISHDGRMVSYEVNPQEGDGHLWLHELEKDKKRSFARGGDAAFSPCGSFMAFRIRPQHDSVRQAKLAGRKKDELPQDSLGIWLAGSDSLLRFPELKSFRIPEKGSRPWMAWLMKEQEIKTDTVEPDTSATAEKKKTDGKKKGKKAEGETLMVYLAGSGEQAHFNKVTEYIFSKNGSLLAFLSVKKDSIDSVFVHAMPYPDLQSRLVYAGPGYAKSVAADDEGRQLAWLFSADTGKVKVYELKLWDPGNDRTITAADTLVAGMPEGWCVSEHGKVYFSGNGRRLFFGTAAIPAEEPKDTLTEDEKVSVDIWNWKDDRLQPQQLKQKENDLKRSFEAVYHIPQGKMVQLAGEESDRLNMDRKHNGPYTLGYSRKPYLRESSWDADRYQDAWLININKGEKTKVLEKVQSWPRLSPLGKYIAYYDAPDSSWNTYSVKNGKHTRLTEGLPVSFSREEHDMPGTPGPYGIVGWTGNDRELLVYDRYDIWALDPEGKRPPYRITHGRDNRLQYRYLSLDPEQEHIPSDQALLLRAFDETSKDIAFCNFSLDGSTPMNEVFRGPYRFNSPKKARHANRLIWQKMNFMEFPDLYSSRLDFSETMRLSNANPQQDEYCWGTVELVHWTSADGIALEGLLYKPENFDPDSSYPMIVYFYEKYSDGLHAHYIPRPSRSTVNFTFYVSNGYLVFVPDIVYTTGYPGQGAYDAVVSGTLKLLENPWVDREHIGIQGQSWGGYQVAWLITQTNMFAAAMAGAPVSNMTSAYGGIRWGSGVSRMFQYEGSQSRIGGTLWEKPWRYIENSPVFFVDKVETPLLIMHNDDDGAVPWYQGIELFTALRRLDKPVWMLTYNGAPHNLKRRADSKDLSIRMKQFFDHYLKGAPAPVWMEYGVPAVEKGKNPGLELVR
jgi:acetyl esterase/lipase